MRSVCNLVGKCLNKANSCPALIIMHLITMRQPLAILYYAAFARSSSQGQIHCTCKCPCWIKLDSDSKYLIVRVTIPGNETMTHPHTPGPHTVFAAACSSAHNTSPFNHCSYEAEPLSSESQWAQISSQTRSKLHLQLRNELSKNESWFQLCISLLACAVWWTDSISFQVAVRG